MALFYTRQFLWDRFLRTKNELQHSCVIVILAHENGTVPAASIPSFCVTYRARYASVRILRRIEPSMDQSTQSAGGRNLEFSRYRTRLIMVCIPGCWHSRFGASGLSVPGDEACVGPCVVSIATRAICSSWTGNSTRLQQ